MIRRGSYFYVFVILALLFTLGGQAQPASARQEPAPRYRTITVTTTKDDITKNGNCTLREAVQAANTNKTVDKCPAGSSSSTDVIKLGRGTYVLSITGRNEHANKKG
ncbi:MAG: CSLREA domain-containing protein, partial [Chloroflexi bacterium]